MQQLPESLLEILPPGHPQSEVRRPAGDTDFLYAKTVECPVCHAAFSVFSIRESRLVTEKICPDFRVISSNFELLWYLCLGFALSVLYAQPYTQFEQLSPMVAGRIGDSSALSSKGVGSVLVEPPTLQEVILSYFLVLQDV